MLRVLIRAVAGIVALTVLCSQQGSAAVQTQQTDLAEGWNLISLPLTPADRRLTQVLAPIWEQVKSVWAYDPMSGQWQRHVVNGPKFLNNLVLMQPGKGYWLELRAAATLTVTGEETEGEGVFLGAGWTLAGYNSLTAQPVADALASIASLHGTVRTYDAATGQWQVYSIGGRGDLTELKPWQGYWIECSQTTRWGGLPPDPADVAPPIDPTVPTRLARELAFLYEGDNPIQLGVVPGTIEEQRIAVLRGRVIAADESPIPGVRVSIKDHDEYGYTMTRADGGYDMAVNGGAPLTVSFSKDGFFQANRQTPSDWEDLVVLADVVLREPDPVVTAVDLDDPVGMQAARGSSVSDADGARQATLLIPQGTGAQMRMPDGSTQPLGSVSVRATEYTVGDLGHDSMPEVLPPTSGYTYCVEYSVDEALRADAGTVEFDQPLYHYVENFLDFPVGGIVPTGYYDKQTGTWMPSANGRVIQVLSEAAGTVELDTDGSGTPADAGALAALGVTAAEREQLAVLYDPGAELWRVPIEHFTPWDCNWPYGPPPGASGPGDGEDDEDPEDDEHEDDPCEGSGGSVLEYENQVLGERLPITGTPYSFVYRSNRVRGRVAAYRVDVPVSGEAVPPDARRMVCQLQVAGRSITERYAPAPDILHTFEWDGKDLYERDVQGIYPGKVRVGYVYEAVYLEPGQFEAVFGGISDSGNSVEGGRGRDYVTIWREWDVILGLFNALPLGLGGWTIDVHHTYDLQSSTLIRGDGRTRRTGDVAVGVISTIAGGGVDETDGAEALEANIRGASGIAIGPDGSIYLKMSYKVRRVSPDGFVHTVAGTGAPGYSGDGGPASAATLNLPAGIAVGPDGSLYIADTYNHRVRRVGPDGIIDTIAGTGAAAHSGDGGLATEAGVFRPESVALAADGSIYIHSNSPDGDVIRRIGTDGKIRTMAGGGYPATPDAADGGPATGASLGVKDICMAPDGGLYVADWRYGPLTGGSRIRHIGPDGTINTIVGSTKGFAGDGGDATEAFLNLPDGIAVDDLGRILIADGGNHRIRMARPGGVIATVAGGGDLPYPAVGDGGPATRSVMAPVDVDFGPDGCIYVLDTGRHTAVTRVRKIETGLPSAARTDRLVSSEDGREIYVFDFGGRHLRTMDALTGATLYSFAYDDAGLLVRITDAFGNITAIARTADGTPTMITGPYGARTLLDTDTNGYLSAIVNPAGNRLDFEYSADGLMSARETGEDLRYEYTYNELGRFVRADRPDAGFTMLNRDKSLRGHTILVTTSEGRTSTYRVENLPTGGRRNVRALCGGCGRETAILTRSDASGRIEYPDGMVIETRTAPDDRLGMSTPQLTAMTVATPAGLLATLEVNRTSTYTDSDDPSTLESVATTYTINGNDLRFTYDIGLRQAAMRSAESRKIWRTYDAWGRPVEDRVGRINARAFYGYDDRGRPNRLTWGTGSSPATDRVYTAAFNDAGAVDVFTDPLGRTTTLGYDDAGRLTSLLHSSGIGIAATYNADGQLSSLTPPGRPVHTMTYTDGGRLGAHISPTIVGVDDPVTRFGYDLDGHLTSITRPDGGVIQYVRGAATERLEQLILPDGETIDYGYFDGVPAGKPDTGQLGTITRSSSGTLGFSYDGSLLLEESWSGDVSGIVGRTYASGFLTDRLYLSNPDMAWVDYDYDDDEFLARATVSMATMPGVRMDILRFGENGLLRATIIGEVSHDYTINDFGETKSVSVEADGTPVMEIIYDSPSEARDKLGRIVEQVETVEGTSTVIRYAYDEAGRLTDVWRNGTHTSHYAYDLNGNRTTHTNPAAATGITPDQVVHDAQDRLLQYGDLSFTYTDHGELLTRTAGELTTSYQYDAMGNLRRVTAPDGTIIDYLVDGRNRRIGKKVDGVLQKGFLYQDQLNPVAELDGDGEIVSMFFYATHAFCPDLMLSKKSDGVTWKVYRIVHDHLGGPRLVIDVDSAVIGQRLDYDEFGNIVTDTNPGFQPFGFAGGLYDADTGLTRFGRRDYDAVIGRWTTKDPILFSGGTTNLYEYVRNDPVNAHDPTGTGGVREFFAPMTGDLISNSPWMHGFLDSMTEIPFTDTSIAEQAREALDIDDFVDRCSRRYRAGASIGDALDTILSAIGVAKGPAKLTETGWRAMRQDRGFINDAVGLADDAVDVGTDLVDRID